MSTESKKVWVVGHKNPDTDSICAAISYAYLKNQSGDKKTYVAKRAGAVNEETRYVLERFGVEEPPLVSYAGAQIKDINIRKTAGVSNQISLKRAWELMKKLEVVTLPVTNQFGKLEGVIVTKDIATSYMDVLDNCVLSKARTQYKTIAETIDGEVYAGNEHAHFVRGKVVIATSNPEYMADYIEDDDLVILGDREEAQMQAIRSNASCIIIGGGLEVAEEVKKLAEKRDCVIITTPFDTFSVARLINQSMPIKQYMTRRELVTFDIDDYVDDVKDVMSRVRHRDFPVLGSNGNYVGMISRRNLMNMQKKTDHSCRPQREVTGGGRNRRGGDLRDHRPSQTGKLRDRIAGLFPESAARLYVDDYLSDVSGAEGGDSEGDRGTSALSDHFRHADVPLTDLHAA